MTNSRTTGNQTSGSLSHLTLNTGHIARIERTSVAQEVIDHLLPVIDAEGGPVPGVDGWYLDFQFPLTQDGRRNPGAAFFQISDEPGTSKRPAVMAIACWDAAMTGAAWSQVRGGYQAMREPLRASKLWREPPTHAPVTPWLAVWLTPFAILYDAHFVGMWGDLEKCVAFALIDA
jgi:hypothetical protein